MPNVTYNGQSFAIDGRRIWLLGASVQYARIPAALWADRLAAAKQAGFNTVETACPWVVHEPRSGRFVFQGDADLRKFIELCAQLGLRVILRIGPYIGSHFDGGGLPGWLTEMPGIKLREGNELFLEHVSRYFRKLLSEVADLQIANGGPILLIQSEHAWTCSNESQVERYLHEITRFIRESGLTVPIINANDLWQEIPGTIDTWRGYDGLLVHLRQLRTVQSDAPRLVSAFEAAGLEIWGGDKRDKSNRSRTAARDVSPSSQPVAHKSPGDVLRHLAEVLASGAQPFVMPFHGGTNFGFLAGRIAGCPDGFITTTGYPDAPLGEAGVRGAKYSAIRRLVMFANHFSHVFAELDPDYQPIVLDPALIDASDAADNHRDSAIVSVVPVRGPHGRIVFVFGNSNASTILALDDGVRLPIHLGDQRVGWFALDVDLHGAGRLDFANVCPWAIIDRSIVVFHGPAGAQVYLSIAGSPLETTVPAEGTKPFVAPHKGLTVVICNPQQIDASYHDDSTLYVGVAGFDAKGEPVPHPDFAKSWVIRRDGRIDAVQLGSSTREMESRGRKPGRGSGIAVGEWQVSATTAYVTGESPRFASLEGPETLSGCGAPSGYGWYRIAMDAAGRKICHLPEAADRIHLFMEGRRQAIMGVGPGADPGPTELKFGKGSVNLVALVDNFGRFCEGNDLAQRKGIYGHLYEVKAMRSTKPRISAGRPVDPFELRGFISGRAAGQVSHTQQAVWSFSHVKKTPILVDINGAKSSGTFVLNDQPISYYAGAGGACLDRILLHPESTKGFKRGNNVLRFAPDLRRDDAAEELAKCTELYECVETLTESASWAFAKWEPPGVTAYSPVQKADFRTFKGLPCWWRAMFDVSSADAQLPLWLAASGLSKGQAYINGNNLGRYFTATAEGRAAGPQLHLYVPSPWLNTREPNELLLFDEHGFDPSQVRLVRSAERPDRS